MTRLVEQGLADYDITTVAAKLSLLDWWIYQRKTCKKGGRGRRPWCARVAMADVVEAAFGTVDSIDFLEVTGDFCGARKRLCAGCIFAVEEK